MLKTNPIKWLLVEWENQSDYFDVINVRSLVDSHMNGELHTGKIVLVGFRGDRIRRAKIVMTSDDRTFLDHQLIAMEEHCRQQREQENAYRASSSSSNNVGPAPLIPVNTIDNKKRVRNSYDTANDSWSEDGLYTFRSSDSDCNANNSNSMQNERNRQHSYYSSARPKLVSRRDKVAESHRLSVPTSNRYTLSRKEAAIKKELFRSEYNRYYYREAKRHYNDHDQSRAEASTPMNFDQNQFRRDSNVTRAIIYDEDQPHIIVPKNRPIPYEQDKSRTESSEAPKIAYDQGVQTVDYEQRNNVAIPMISKKLTSLRQFMCDVEDKMTVIQASIDSWRPRDEVKVDKKEMTPQDVQWIKQEWSTPTNSEKTLKKTAKKSRQQNHREIAPENIDQNDMVCIGPGKTMVPKQIFKRMDWNSYTMATRKLLMATFSRRTLATSCLTGKSSPAFTNRPAKECLDQTKVNDIVSVVTDKCGVTENLVRSAITTKCSDENKMFRNRQQKNEKSKAVQKNQENIPPEANKTLPVDPS